MVLGTVQAQDKVRNRDTRMQWPGVGSQYLSQKCGEVLALAIWSVMLIKRLRIFFFHWRWQQEGMHYVVVISVSSLRERASCRVLNEIRLYQVYFPIIKVRNSFIIHSTPLVPCPASLLPISLPRFRHIGSNPKQWWQKGGQCPWGVTGDLIPLGWMNPVIAQHMLQRTNDDPKFPFMSFPISAVEMPGPHALWICGSTDITTLLQVPESCRLIVR